MNDNAIKNYAIWARRELMAEVEKRCTWWGISEDSELDADMDTIDGRVLSVQERKQRASLLCVVQSEGYTQLVERAAYTWFNRLLAIRFMELNDRLPSHVRMLSATDGSFEPQCLREAMDLPLKALDKEEAVRLVQSGDDEALFRLVFLAQCAELADCMPAVFEPVGSAMELLLPTGLLRTDSVVGKLVNDIPEEDWREGVEIVGWMYQYYVSERKDEVFASFKKGKKAEREAIAPATQLFTPHWIVRYLVENSLGRLWMLNHPDSKLVDKMPYFIKSDEEDVAEFRRVSSPEEITCVDPACGSGHIAVYAFDLLAAMYEEAGYSSRDAARLIIEKNLIGLEIDPRAATMASFALTMKACELDSRFLRRGVVPKVVVLERIEFEPDELELCPNLAEKTALLDAIAHLEECGSLLQPTQEDLTVIERDLASLAECDSLFAISAISKLEHLLVELRPLVNNYAVVVANPPYMGSGAFDKWVSNWIKQNYPDTKIDLCTCFIERGLTLVERFGFSAMVTMQSWMFLGSYNGLRQKILKEHGVVTMAHLGARAFDAIGGEVVSTTATVFSEQQWDLTGSFLRLVDYPGELAKSKLIIEAANQTDMSNLYYKSNNDFLEVPGSPIAYWASESLIRSFNKKRVGDYADPRRTLQTGDAPRFMREWFEVNNKDTCRERLDRLAAIQTGYKWFYFNYGGQFRKWYGNLYQVVDWENDGERIKSTGKAIIPSEESYFEKCVAWSKISSGPISMRMYDQGLLPGDASACLFNVKINDSYMMAALNSSAITAILKILNPTLNYPTGTIAELPLVEAERVKHDKAVDLAEANVDISRSDWDESETSWDFKRHPLV